MEYNGIWKQTNFYHYIAGSSSTYLHLSNLNEARQHRGQLAIMQTPGVLIESSQLSASIPVA